LDILKIALVSGAFFLFSYITVAQSGVLELLPGAEKLGYNQKTGAHRLVGKVNFIYQGNTMYCDSAHYFDKTQEVRAYGNVHITKDDINLYCDSLYYNGKTKRAKLWGHVRVRDLEYKLSTDTLEYDAKKAQGIYRHGGKIESITSNEVLTSRIGYFYPDNKNFFFSGKVRYRNDDLQMTTDTLQYLYSKQTTYFYGPTKIVRDSTIMFCERGWYNIKTEEGSLIKNALIQRSGREVRGDTLFYQPTIGRSTARGNVIVSDSAQRTLIKGKYGLNDEKNHFSLVTGNAVASQVREKDTLYIFADTLFNQNDSLDKSLFIKAYRNAKFFQESAQAKADSIYYSRNEGRIELFKDPIVWSSNAELRGDSMTVFLKDSIIERVFIRENSIVVMELDSGQYYNQIGGERINALFKDQSLYRTDVSGSATTVFYPEEKKENDTTVTVTRMGMNRIYAADLRIYLDSGEITGVTYFDKPDGVFFPMSDIPEEELFIRNFGWNSALRPKRSLIEGIYSE
jgi:lipopolysaccharide export system protein LptA